MAMRRAQKHNEKYRPSFPTVEKNKKHAFVHEEQDQINYFENCIALNGEQCRECMLYAFSPRHNGAKDGACRAAKKT